MRTKLLHAAPAALLAGVVGIATLVGTADAVSDTKPVACTGLAFKDAKADQNHLQVPEAERTGSTELLGGFLDHDPAKAGEATTYNIVVSDLKAQVPAGWTTQSWNAYYQVPGEQEGNFRLVRAILDFTGAVAYEHGRFVANPAGLVLTGATVYDGTTTGKLFEGKEGVVQIVVPAELVKPGMPLQGLYASSGQGRTAPASFPGYTRGLSHVLDTAPDEGGGKWTVAPCPAAAGGGTGGGSTGGGGTGGGSTGGGGTGGGGTGGGGTGGGGTGGGGGDSGSNPSPTSSGTALPVTLSRSAVKAPKGKRLKLALKSSETVTDIGARLRKGSKALGTGKLARLDGTGSLTLKLGKKLRKGSYVLDLAGNRSSGERAVTSLRLKLR